MTKHEELQEKFPFLTGIEFSQEEFVGIVQNKDAQILSFYDIEKCRNDEEKKVLLELGLFGDGTSFGDLDVNTICEQLQKLNYESYGNEILAICR